MDRRGSSFNNRRAYPSVSERRRKAKEEKMREEVAAKTRNIQMTILQWQLSPAETFLRNLQADRKSKAMLWQIQIYVIRKIDLV